MPAPGMLAPRAPAAPAEHSSQSPANIAALADRADIRPLEVPAALQILLAEVHSAFQLQAIAMGADSGELLDSPPQAARALLQMLLRALPDVSSLPEWNSALLRAETALRTGLGRGIDAITVWRDVPAVVVDAASETRSLVFSALGDDPPNPIWLRPEWAGLAPRFERFWRRRRQARRYLTDPDYSRGGIDEDNQPQS